MLRVSRGFKRAHSLRYCYSNGVSTFCSSSSLKPHKSESTVEDGDGKEDEGTAAERRSSKAGGVGKSSEELTGRGTEALKEGLDISQEYANDMKERYQDMQNRAKHMKDRAQD